MAALHQQQQHKCGQEHEQATMSELLSNMTIKEKMPCTAHLTTMATIRGEVRA